MLPKSIHHSISNTHTHKHKETLARHSFHIYIIYMECIHTHIDPKKIVAFSFFLWFYSSCHSPVDLVGERGIRHNKRTSQSPKKNHCFVVVVGVIPKRTTLPPPPPFPFHMGVSSYVFCFSFLSFVSRFSCFLFFLWSQWGVGVGDDNGVFSVFWHFFFLGDMHVCTREIFHFLFCGFFFIIFCEILEETKKKIII